MRTENLEKFFKNMEYQISSSLWGQRILAKLVEWVSTSRQNKHFVHICALLGQLKLQAPLLVFIIGPT